MFETSILTGKVTTSGTGPNTDVQKKLYVKVFAGEFSERAPTPKKAKQLLGELVIKYSAREWPVKKYGNILDDPGFLEGVKELLRDKHCAHVDALKYSPTQYDAKDTITLRVGKALAQEMLDRGWAKLTK